jgi:hypothetical protein
MYLGDGCVSLKPRGGAQLQLACDADYPGVIEDCRAVIVLTTLGGHVTSYRVPEQRCVRVACAWKRWPEVFPQHGPGRKHERPDRARAVAARDRRCASVGVPARAPALRRCRTINRFKTRLPSGRVVEYAYPRWFFSNLSADIRALFCAYCDRVGVRWTRSNQRNISISHRRSVALLDTHVGPKT